MPRKPVQSTSAPRSRFFERELAGEVAPTLSELRMLYILATELFALQPWEFVDETQLIVVPDSRTGENWYCSVMGALGEVFALHAYRGEAGLRLFRRIQNEEITDAGEALSMMDCLFVEFVSSSELRRQDRELLAALDHPRGRGLATPIFRAQRPGYHPWFVNANEALTLADCIRAFLAYCASDRKKWPQDMDGVYPMVRPGKGAEAPFQIDLVRPVLPTEPAASPTPLPDEMLHALRGRDYPVRGVIELDYAVSGAAVGKPHERPRCTAIALAVDANSGMVLAPLATAATVPPDLLLAQVFLEAVHQTGMVPCEIRIRKTLHRPTLASLTDQLGIHVRIMKRMPAAEQARRSLLDFMERRG